MVVLHGCLFFFNHFQYVFPLLSGLHYFFIFFFSLFYGLHNLNCSDFRFTNTFFCPCISTVEPPTEFLISVISLLNSRISIWSFKKCNNLYVCYNVLYLVQHCYHTFISLIMLSFICMNIFTVATLK